MEKRFFCVMFFLSTALTAGAAGAQWGGFNYQSLLIPVLVLVCVVAILLAIGLFLRNYIKVPPNQVAVISGRKRKISEGGVVGFRLVHGGATFKWPMLERVDYLDLNAISIPTMTRGAITREGVPLSVEAIANVKIGSDDVSLRNASERFLGMPVDAMHNLIALTLEAHLRAICCTLSIEEINSDRQRFAQKMITEAAEDLRKMGIQIDVWAVQHVQDDQGYLESLGKKRTAEVKRDALVGEAEAKRDAEIKTAAAQRDATKQATDAQREGEVKRCDNLAEISKAEKELNVRRAQYDAETAIERAKAEQAKPRAEADAKKDVYIAQVNAEKAKVEEETKLQEKVAQRTEKELDATVLRKAEAERKRLVIEAEAYQKAIVLRASGDRDAAVNKADAEREVQIREGDGEAYRVKIVGEAEGAKIRAIKVAEAEGEAANIEKKGLAEGEAIKAKLLAEAEGLQKKAEAYKMLEESAKLMFILEKAPGVIESVGKAAGDALGPAFDSIGKGMANIDKVVIVETGGGGDGVNGLTRFASTAPTLIFQMMQQARALGLDPSRILDKIGIDVIKDVGLSRADAAGTPVTPQAAAPLSATPPPPSPQKPPALKTARPADGK